MARRPLCSTLGSRLDSISRWPAMPTRRPSKAHTAAIISKIPVLTGTRLHVAGTLDLPLVPVELRSENIGTTLRLDLAT